MILNTIPTRLLSKDYSEVLERYIENIDIDVQFDVPFCGNEVVFAHVLSIHNNNIETLDPIDEKDLGYIKPFIGALNYAAHIIFSEKVHEYDKYRVKEFEDGIKERLREFLVDNKPIPLTIDLQQKLKHAMTNYISHMDLSSSIEFYGSEFLSEAARYSPNYIERIVKHLPFLVSNKILTIETTIYSVAVVQAEEN